MQKSLTRIYYTMSQLKARCIHEDFADKRKTGCIIRLWQIGWSVWRSYLLSSLILTLL